jgi:peptidoglycan/LPS O-acetylase OafA/YrhL
MSGLTRYRYIDALRGFAFLGVLTVHASQGEALPVGGRIADAGQFGVQLFFLLSAITLLRSVALRSARERFPIRNFFVRRLFRIGPLFWSAIVFYFLVNGSEAQFFAPNGLGPWHYLSTALFLHGWGVTSFNSVVPGDWSIAAEMTFYLCLPFLASRITSIRSAISLSFCSLVAAVILNGLMAHVLGRLLSPGERYLVPQFLFYWVPSQLPIFLVGFAAYHCLNNEAITQWLASSGRAACFVAGAICVLVGLAHGPIDFRMPRDVCLAVAFALAFVLVVLALHVRPFVVMVNSSTCGLGVISFSCYITHFAALKVVKHLFRPVRFTVASPHLAGVLHFIAIWMAALIITVLASVLTYFLIEKPGIKLGNRIIRSWEGARETALPSDEPLGPEVSPAERVQLPR